MTQQDGTCWACDYCLGATVAYENYWHCTDVREGARRAGLGEESAACERAGGRVGSGCGRDLVHRCHHLHCAATQCTACTTRRRGAQGECDEGRPHQGCATSARCARRRRPTGAARPVPGGCGRRRGSAGAPCWPTFEWRGSSGRHFSSAGPSSRRRHARTHPRLPPVHVSTCCPLELAHQRSNAPPTAQRSGSRNRARFVAGTATLTGDLRRSIREDARTGRPLGCIRHIF